MNKKVQSVGINKESLIAIHKQLIVDVMKRGYEIDDNLINDLTRYSMIYSRVIMYGISELENETVPYKLDIIQELGTDYQGINKYISDNIEQRKAEDYTKWLLEKLKFSENFIIRAIENIDTPKEEEDFLLLITAFEDFLQEEYSKILLPLLKKSEVEIKAGLKAIYDNTELTEQEAIKQAEDYLDAKEKELIDLFNQEVQKKLNDKAIEEALILIALINLSKLEQKEIEKQRSLIEYQYLSNVNAFFFNSIRRLRETFVDNIYNQANLRSLATNQLQEIAFNESIFKLSVLTHSRSLFRGLIALASTSNHFKALVPKNIISSLNPNGTTANNVYLIKTKEEWSKTKDLTNVNVVEGMSLHHGDQIYYRPIFDLEKEKEISQKQRTNFLKTLK